MPKVSRKITHYVKKQEEEEEFEEEISEDDEDDEDFEEKKVKKVKTVKKTKKVETKVEKLLNGEALEKMIDIALSEKQKETVKERLKSFEKLYQEGDAIDWFNELCFCLLTANSKASTAIKIQEFLGRRGFLDKTEEELVSIIANHGHRFKNKKAQFICAARQQFMKKFLKNSKKSEEDEDEDEEEETKSSKTKKEAGISKKEDFKSFLLSKSAKEAREYLVDHVKGLGFKESSHFLRNIGFSDKVAIIDRHVLRF